MDAALYSTIWIALALFTVAEAGKRRWSQHRAVPDWAWPAWLIEAWWWRAYPSRYFGRRRAITWALRAFYFLIIVNAVVVFASVPRRALGVVLVGALVWIWRTGPGVDFNAAGVTNPTCR